MLPNNQDIEKSVLGCLLAGKLDYIIKLFEIDFMSELNRQIYKIIRKLYDNKSVVDEFTVSDALKIDNSFVIIAGLSSYVSSPENMEYYIGILRTYTMRREAIKAAAKIKELAESERYESAIELKSDAMQLLDIPVYSNVKTDNSLGSIVIKAMNDIEKKYNEKKEDKLFTGFYDLDKITAGLHSEELTIIAARPGVGKEQPLYSKILTPGGWVIMGDIKVSDKVIGSDGKEHNVTGVFPQGEKDIYRVYFNDDTFTDCGLEHLWETKTRKERKNNLPASIKTTAEIMDTLTVNQDARLNHSVKYVKPVELAKQDLPLNPYALGLLIGDGIFRDGSIGFSNTEPDIWEKLSDALPNSDKLRIGSDKKDHRITRKQRDNTQSETMVDLKVLGLFGKKSYEKFIPDTYLYSETNDRLQLLRGLLDSDGYVVHGNSIEYSTTSERLSRGVREIVLSLGGRCTTQQRIGRYTKNKIYYQARDNYRVNISFNNGIIPVSSKKHLKKYRKSVRPMDKFIKDVVFVGKYEAQCIMVDSPDHLYVTDDFILTHNTAYAIQLMLNMAKKECKCLFVSREMSQLQIAKRIISNIALVDGQKLRFCKSLTDTDWQKMGESIGEISKLPIELNDKLSTIQEIRAYCRELKNKDLLDLLIVDYIQLCRSLKKTESRRQEIEDISRQLKEITLEFGIPVIALSQLSRESEKAAREPVLSDLRESGSLEQDADNVIFLHVPKDTDEKQGNFDIKVIVGKQRNGPTGYIWLKYYRRTFQLCNIYRG